MLKLFGSQCHLFIKTNVVTPSGKKKKEHIYKLGDKDFVSQIQEDNGQDNIQQYYSARNEF